MAAHVMAASAATESARTDRGWWSSGARGSIARRRDAGSRRTPQAVCPDLGLQHHCNAAVPGRGPSEGLAPCRRAGGDWMGEDRREPRRRCGRIGDPSTLTVTAPAKSASAMAGQGRRDWHLDWRAPRCFASARHCAPVRAGRDSGVSPCITRAPDGVSTCHERQTVCRLVGDRNRVPATGRVPTYGGSTRLQRGCPGLRRRFDSASASGWC